MSDKQPKKKKKREILINGASLDALKELVNQLLTIPGFKAKLKTKITHKNKTSVIWWTTEKRMQQSMQKAEAVVESFLDQAFENGNTWKIDLSKGYKQGQCHVSCLKISKKGWQQPAVMFSELVYNGKSKNWVPKFIISPETKPGTFRIYIGGVRISVDVY